jgi:methylmalonyl-CoA/ethylmalonyl-CoA epimerase
MSSIARTDSVATRPAKKFHHVGYVTNSIDEAVADFIGSISGTWDGAIFSDPLQKVRVTFVRLGRDQPMFELVEPTSEDSPVKSFLRRGGGIHHVCFEVSHLETELEEARMRGDVTAKPPLPAAAFSGRRIAWVYTRRRMLIEYLER